MTPTPQEKQWLCDYLYSIMDYRETFEEVYDHILLALDNEPRPQFFESAVTKIIANEFGSDNGLYELEQSCKQAADRDAITQYFDMMKLWLSPKLILFTGLVFVSLCLLGSRYPFVLLMLFIGFSTVPFLFVTARKVVNYFRRPYVKPSLKDQISRDITYRVTAIIWGWAIMLDGIGKMQRWVFGESKPQAQVVYHKYQPMDVNAATIVIGLFFGALLTWIIIHLITVFKLYQREFKAGMITT